MKKPARTVVVIEDDSDIRERVVKGLSLSGYQVFAAENGAAAELYRSVTHKLFSLADETLVYPGHDYAGRYVSSIAQEKARNPRLGGGKSLAEFQQIMSTLNLPYPKFIDHAVPGNRGCGLCPAELPQELQKYCGPMGESPQG